MSTSPLSRRHLLKSIAAFAAASPILAACSLAPASGLGANTPSSGAATSGGAQSGQAPAAKPTQAAAGQATQAPAAQPAASNAAVNMTLAVYTDRPWMKHWAQEWVKKSPNVSLQIDDIAYGDMNTKQLAQLGAGTMEDVTFSGNKWLRYSAYKGAFMAMDDFAKSKPYDKEDLIPSAVDGGMFEGKLYGLPFEWNPGNINVVMYNKDMLQAKGVAEPVDNWTHEDFAKFATQMTDSANGVYGTDLWPGTYYDFGDLVRDLGGDVMSDDGKTFLFGTDDKNRQVIEWLVDLRTKLKVAPPRAFMQQEQIFPSGKIASTATNAVSVKSTIKQIGSKFKWGVALGPAGPNGLRGYDSFSAHWNTYAKSQHGEQAYDLIMTLISKEAALYALQTDGQVPSRLSVWKAPESNTDTDIFKRVAAWIGDGKSKGPFPIPANLRYTELETAYENTSFPMFYGEVDVDTGVKQVQAACQKIMDQPRG
jgi:ABC-type glycerol-3-phosphate transport system substrate-binding protein